jgi:hypothetical protein
MGKIPADIWRTAKDIIENVEYDDWDDDSTKAIAYAIADERRRCSMAARIVRNEAELYDNTHMRRAAGMIIRRIESGQ